MIENELTIFLKTFSDQQVVPSNLYETIKPIGSHLPRLYRLQKLLRPDIPLRAILDHKHQVKHSVKDVIQSIIKVRNINTKGKTIISSNVTSLLTLCTSHSRILSKIYVNNLKNKK